MNYYVDKNFMDKYNKIKKKLNIEINNEVYIEQIDSDYLFLVNYFIKNKLCKFINKENIIICLANVCKVLIKIYDIFINIVVVLIKNYKLHKARLSSNIFIMIIFAFLIYNFQILCGILIIILIITLLYEICILYIKFT